MGHIRIVPARRHDGKEYAASQRRRFRSLRPVGRVIGVQEGGRALLAFAEADLRDTLVEVSVPTPLLYGEHDVRLQKRVWEPIHQGIAHSKLAVIPGVGHMIDLQAPDRCNAEIRTLLRGD